MGFVKNFGEIMAAVKESADFYDAETLTLFWETKPEIVKKLVPAPLEPPEKAVAMAFTASYPATNFGVSYRESALFLSVRFNGEEGSYCLSMPVTHDMAMAAGREMFGYPKKIGDIFFRKEGALAEGWTERQGIRFMEMRAVLDGEFNDPDAGDILNRRSVGNDGSFSAVSFNFKHFPGPEGGTFDYPPRLIRQETLFRPREIMVGKGEIVFRPSTNDPWSEVDVVRMLGAIYMKGDNSMLGGKVVAESDIMGFLPFAFLKWDMA